METNKRYQKTLLACYIGFVTQAICANFAPLLFMVFYNDYEISLGKLALISTTFFITQLVTDFICAKVVDKIGYRPCMIVAELTSGIGLMSLAILPDIFPSPFMGILIAVIIYAIGSGLTEVLASPIIEACPFENKESMMSLLHSFYCWGFVGVILCSTLFFTVFGLENWRILALLWALIPLYNIYNFVTCPIEPLLEDGESMTMGQLLKSKLFWVLIALMICAGASEVAMAQWASAFAESALNVSKIVGDLAGPCGFAILMGISRVLYGKFGEKINLSVFMIVSGVLCLFCYLLAGLANIPILGLVGCSLCGFSIGIMWPGSLSMSSKVMPKGGTAMFALLALGGDLGASIAPAIVGAVSENAGNNLQIGVLTAIVFPIGLVICVLALRKRYKIRHENCNEKMKT